jgi:hypothetical protein
MAQAALACAENTILLREMANCGPYSVVGYAYAPETSACVEGVIEILIISGRVDDTVALDEHSWGEVKTLYK